MSNLSIFSDDMVKIAYDFYVNKSNNMAFYMLLLGYGKYKVEAFPGAGHNYYEILQSIYKYKEEHPEVNAGIIFENTLDYCASKITTTTDFVMVMNYIFTQLENEKKNLSPFKINVVRILNTLKSWINEYEQLQKDSLFLEQLKSSEEYLQKNYGHRII